MFLSKYIIYFFKHSFRGTELCGHGLTLQHKFYTNLIIFILMSLTYINIITFI